jgi:hypothetical protein
MRTGGSQRRARRRMRSQPACAFWLRLLRARSPEADDLMVEGFDAVGVQGHAVVVDVPSDDRKAPTCLRDGVHASVAAA